MPRINWSEVVDSSVGIIQSFIARGVTPTVRTVYYALFSKGVIPNTMSAYKGLSRALVDARKKGLVSWRWIADDTRSARHIYETCGVCEGVYLVNYFHDYVDPEEYAEGYVNRVFDSDERYTLPKWRNQPKYVEAWIEKFALAGTFYNWLREFHVPLIPSRGYSSWTFLKKAADRIKTYAEDKEVILLYFGDWDPSGVDIERFLGEAMLFFGLDVEVKRIAVDSSQIEKYGLPPAPAKTSDSRAEGFIARYGEDCVELDALLAFVPDEFEKIVKTSVAEYFDEDVYAEVQEEESEAKETVKETIMKLLKERLEETEGGE